MRAVAIVAVLALALASSTAAAEDYKGESIPFGEAGLLLPVTLRRQETQDPDPMKPTGTNGTNVGVVLRAEAGLLPLLSMALSPRLRLGDYLGVDLGIAAKGFAGRIVIGLQASYELTELVGVGVRAYFHTVIEGLYYDYGYNNYLVAELSGRVGKITGRVRFKAGQPGNSGYASSDYGASLRIPMGWTIIGAKDWGIAVDYDWLWGEDSTGTAVYHRINVGVVKGF